ncbi:hypothetical protein LBMAG40_12480 [Cyanobium sp.]|nr:hypothetical protein LBMAG40_12480 [Cyanobium sp.]
MLELQDVRYHPATLPQPVLRQVSLKLAVGTPVLVAGRSGSGKTTLLELISGMAEADGGRFLWNNEPVAAPAAPLALWPGVSVSRTPFPGPDRGSGIAPGSAAPGGRGD